MSLRRYITFVNGIKTWAEAIIASTGVADAFKLISTDSTGRISSTFLPVGLGLSTKTYPATEALSAGQFVDIYDNSGTASARVADNTNGRTANGFVLSAVSQGQNALVYLQGENTALTGLTSGTQYYLGAGGAPTTTITTTAGQVIQPLGYGTASGGILFEYDEAVVVG